MAILFTLDVRDSGVGFVTNHNSHGMHGLQSMAERARIAGGQFQIKSVPGEGTRVIVDLPFVAYAFTFDACRASWDSWITCGSVRPD